MNEFIISYVTTLPKSANAPYVKIVGDYEQTYHVSFNDNKGKMLGYGYCKNNQILFSGWLAAGSIEGCSIWAST
jgi:hypothetical protein